MFRKLKGRLVVINTANGSSFNGTVVRAGLRSVDLTGCRIIEPGIPEGAATGTVRVARRIVTWIQVA